MLLGLRVRRAARGVQEREQERERELERAWEREWERKREKANVWMVGMGDDHKGNSTNVVLFDLLLLCASLSSITAFASTTAFFNIQRLPWKSC